MVIKNASFVGRRFLCISKIICFSFVRQSVLHQLYRKTSRIMRALRDALLQSDNSVWSLAIYNSGGI